MNLIQMAELTQSCPDLQGVFDLAASSGCLIGPFLCHWQLKGGKREVDFLPMDEREESRNR